MLLLLLYAALFAFCLNFSIWSLLVLSVSHRVSHFRQIAQANKVKVTGAVANAKSQIQNSITVDCTPAGTCTSMNIIF